MMAIMKILLAVLACVCATGCAAPQNPKVLTPLDNGREFTLAVGQVLVVNLPSNRTTGYSWTLLSTNETVLEPVGEAEYQRNPAPTGMVGVGGNEIWRFRAAKTGRETLRLGYARPWEKGVAPVQTVAYDVTVK